MLQQVQLNKKFISEKASYEFGKENVGNNGYPLRK